MTPLAVLDVGSNSAHLRIADLVPGLAPDPVRLSGRCGWQKPPMPTA